MERRPGGSAPRIPYRSIRARDERSREAGQTSMGVRRHRDRPGRTASGVRAGFRRVRLPWPTRRAAREARRDPELHAVPLARCRRQCGRLHGVPHGRPPGGAGSEGLPCRQGLELSGVPPRSPRSRLQARADRPGGLRSFADRLPAQGRARARRLHRLPHESEGQPRRLHDRVRVEGPRDRLPLVPRRRRSAPR